MFERDFTLKKYRALCHAVIEAGYSTLPVRDFLLNGGENIVILRHDVDRRPGSALAMARLENELGIRSTYYFRATKDVFIPDVIEEIERLGHEIGYHYEVLDKAKGDREVAINMFQKELGDLRNHADIQTIAMHGNPLTHWTAEELWKGRDFSEFGIIGDSSISIDYSKVQYLGDVGRTWDGKYSVKDLLVKDRSGSFRTTDDVIKAIAAKKISKACLVAHPNRWNDDLGKWLLEFTGQRIKNIGKWGIISYRNFHKQ
jgi:hypothetical protein